MLRALIIAGMLLTLGGCDSKEDLRSFCSRDEDCPPGFRCDSATGLCLCATDEVCQADEYCAPDGVCRPRLSCENNTDCDPGMFCDTTTGNCIEIGKCTSDVQCDFGEICSDVYFKCVSGCRQNGDCPLGQICREDRCIDGCEDSSYCGYGQLCDEDNQTCYDDTRGPYCAYCRSATIYEPHQCGSGPNFCLVKGGELDLPPYCGVDCSQGQPCPNGYGCFSVRIVYTSWNCASNDDCDSGSCYIKEGDQLGFCLCTADEQCPQDSCDDFTMECRTTRRPCTPGGNECARKIYCIDGFCHIGYNCKPIEGLRCEDILR